MAANVTSNKFQETQAKFGPYYFGFDHGNAGNQSVNTAPSGYAGAPAISASSPYSFGGMLSSAALGGRGLGDSTISTVGKGINLGLTGLGMLGVPGLQAITVPSLVLGLLSHGARLMGMPGGETSGNVSQSTAEANGFTSPAAMAAIAQGLGLSAAQLASINSNAPFGNPATNPSNFTDALGGPTGPTEGNTGIGGIGTGGQGETAYHKGGRVKPGPPKGRDVQARLQEGEYVVNTKATQLRRSLLDAINAGADKTTLASILKAGR